MKYQWDFCRIFMTVDGSAAESSVTWLAGAIGPWNPQVQGDLPEKSETTQNFTIRKFILMARVHHLHRWASLVPSCKEALKVGNLAWTVGLIMGIQHDTTIV